MVSIGVSTISIGKSFNNFILQRLTNDRIDGLVSLNDALLIFTLIHLNDYHRMTFAQIGDWLESKDI
jgi:hypothetical protein